MVNHDALTCTMNSRTIHFEVCISNLKEGALEKNIEGGEGGREGGREGETEGERVCKCVCVYVCVFSSQSSQLSGPIHSHCIQQLLLQHWMPCHKSYCLGKMRHYAVLWLQHTSAPEMHPCPLSF